MANILPRPAVGARSSVGLPQRLKTEPAYQAFWLLRIGFTVAPIAFGHHRPVPGQV